MQEITKYPLFGKANLVESPLGGIAYNIPGTGVTTSPAIRAAFITQTVAIDPLTPVRPFSNGSEFDGWYCGNCGECSKSKPVVDPNDLKRGGCALELRVVLACYGDGYIPLKTANRIGVQYVSVQKNGVFARLASCKEKVFK